MAKVIQDVQIPIALPTTSRTTFPHEILINLHVPIDGIWCLPLRTATVARIVKLQFLVSR